MGIFLSILKIIGIVLLCILGFILLILMLVLFVPFTYQIKGAYHQDINAEAKAGWLFSLIGVQMVFADKAMKLYLRILGFIKIPLGKDKENEESPPEPVPEGRPPETKKDAVKPKAEILEKPKAEIQEKPKEEIPEKPKEALKEKPDKEPEIKPEKPEEKEPGPEEKKEERPEEKKEERPEEKTEEGAAEEKSLEEKISDWIEGKLELLQKKKEELNEKLEDLKDKKDFIFYERTQNAIHHVLSIVMKMLKHILPSKLSGEVELGLKSPADTGQVIAIASMLMPLHKNKVRIIPDFENEHIDADVKLKNWIFLIVVLVLALRIILNKDVLYVLKNYKKHFS